MRGYSKGPMFHREFFFIMDCLYNTLDQQIQAWSMELNPNGKPGLLKKFFGGRGCLNKHNEEVKHAVLLQRLTATYDLASAITYMHKNK
jgi:hypothetical protein